MSLSLNKICFCNEVFEIVIVNAIRKKGARTVADVQRITKAGKDCGKCKPKTQAILDRELPLLDENKTS
jgi:nitrite reductase (NADH) large subunit